jgi:hypothetical protein
MTVVVHPCFSSSCRAAPTRPRHAIEVHAPAQAVFTAVEPVTVKEVWFLRELAFIRALPGLAATVKSDCVV